MGEPQFTKSEIDDGDAVTRELDTSYVQWGKLTGKQQKHTLKFWSDENTRSELIQVGTGDEMSYLESLPSLLCLSAARCIQPHKANGLGGVHERATITTFQSFGIYSALLQGLSSRYILV